MNEPARTIPLRWGSYEGRYLAGIALIIAGLICLQGTNANFNPPLALGTLAHSLGWWLLPAHGWRRVVAVGPSLIAVFVLLIGPAGVGILVLSLASWLFVRQRPAIAYLVLVPVLGVGIALRSGPSEYSDMPVALAIMGAVVIGGAWFARGLAAIRQTHSKTHQLTNKIDHAGHDARP